MNDSSEHQYHIHKQSYTRGYVILSVLIMGIAGAAAYVSYDGTDIDFMSAMRTFMGLFFVVFGSFKIAGLRMFAETYAQYDLIAKRFKVYGKGYPFLELLLGALYLASYQPVALNMFVFMLMCVSALGVLRALQRKEQLHCACLGTVVQLPLTTVSLIENIGMATMALVALLALL